VSTRETVGVIGVGYVGLVTAACLAELGHHVVCRDIAPERVAMLQRGEVPIHEPGVPELLQRNAERLTFTLDMEDVFRDARIAIICVDTPPTASGDADLSRVEAVIAALPASAEGAVLVMKSTVPVGTGTRVRSELDARGRQDVGYVSNPEFLREGSAVADFRQPDRVVVGGDRPEDVERVARLYQDLNAPILTTDIASAEMIKLASNAFLATKISFVNEIANVCERVGADVEEVARGMGMDSRIGQSFLRPGIGYGGSCFPKDVTALKQLAGNTG
jgi:UDPglucose 6-dehydrogenase